MKGSIFTTEQLLNKSWTFCWQFTASEVHCLSRWPTITVLLGAQWLSGRVLDSRPKGRGFEPHQRHCVMSLSKNINPSLVLVQPRKTRPFITERLLMGRKESNQTNKTKTALVSNAFVKGKHLSFIHKQGANFHQWIAISIQNQYWCPNYI